MKKLRHKNLVWFQRKSACVLVPDIACVPSLMTENRKTILPLSSRSDRQRMAREGEERRQLYINEGKLDTNPADTERQDNSAAEEES